MPTAATTRRTTWAEVVATTLAVLNTIGACFGAWGLMSGVLDLGPTLTARLPFGSTLLAGLALGLLVGVPNLVLAFLCLVRHPVAPRATVVVGAGMLAWIVVQLAFIRELSYFHPLYATVGVVMIVAGRSAPWAGRGQPNPYRANGGISSRSS